MLLQMLSALLFAQAADHVYRVGNGVSMPAVLHREEPQYSETARRARVSGSVLLKLVVGKDGKAHDIRVARSFGYGLDENAMDAVTRWTFKPAALNGEPVSVESTIEVSFRLLDSDSLHLGALSFDPVAGVIPPMATEVVKPSANGVGSAAGTVGQVGFTVDEQGVASNLTVLKSQDPECDQAMLNALPHWKFRPALKDGRPVAATGRVDYYLGTNPR